VLWSGSAIVDDGCRLSGRKVRNERSSRASTQPPPLHAHAHRFVGLLIVPKLLAQGGNTEIREAVDAVGFNFLRRLLLPLTRPQQPQDQQQQQREQEALQCALALSILGAACRVPELAGSAAAVELLPAVTRVVAAGGVSPALHLQSAARAADAESAADALECALAICSAAGGDAACRAAWRSGGLAAAVAALQQCSSANTASAAREALMGARLTGLLLASLEPPQRAQLFEAQPDTTAAAIASLSHLLGGPQSPAAGTAGGSSSGGSADVGGADAAMCRLEALHALVLILPLLGANSAALSHLQASQSAAPAPSRRRQPWQASIKAGLAGLLTSRVGEVQKRSALQLAAAAAQLLGPRWLLPAEGDSAAAASLTQREAAAAGRFLAVLTEVLCVETPLLLSDAMDADAPVPDRRGRVAMRDAAAEARAADVARLERLRLDDDEEGSGDNDEEKEEGEPRVQEMGEEDESKPSTAAAAAAAAAAMPTAAGGTLTAGQRAAEQLPACYMLLEALIEAAADESAVMERIADLYAADDLHGGAQQLPVLGEEAAAQLVKRLAETAKVILDFLGYMEQHHEAAALGDPLVLGAVRVLGR